MNTMRRDVKNLLTLERAMDHVAVPSGKSTPIYSGSVGRWRKYADALAPLLSQLDASDT